jgi:hypothetical protein
MSDTPLLADPITRIALYAYRRILPSCYLNALAAWCRNKKVSINAVKNKAVLITKKRAPLWVHLSLREDAVVFSIET